MPLVLLCAKKNLVLSLSLISWPGPILVDSMALSREPNVVSMSSSFYGRGRTIRSRNFMTLPTPITEALRRIIFYIMPLVGLISHMTYLLLALLGGLAICKADWEPASLRPICLAGQPTDSDDHPVDRCLAVS